MIRILDIVVSLCAISFLFPLLLPIMLGLKLTGEHYIFYLQPRIGKGGGVFNVIKFATMLKNSPNLSGGFITQKEDPRILPMGRFLRKTKINELPQLVNVFLGQMSIVGPRPVVAQHLELYSEAARKAIINQVPGLTGIASLVFRDEESILDRMPGERKFNHDVIIANYKGTLEIWYANHRSLINYLAIIAFTAWSVIVPGNNLYKLVFKDLPPPPPALEDYL